MENGPSIRKSYLRRYEGTYLIIRTFEVPSYSMYLRTFEGRLRMKVPSKVRRYIVYESG